MWLRTLARRAVRTSQRLPAGVTRSVECPEGLPVLASTEVDIDDLLKRLEDLREVFDVAVPRSAKNCEFLTAVEVDGWVEMAVKETRGTGGRRLWMRLEDIESVVVVLTGLRSDPFCIRAEFSTGADADKGGRRCG